jgi:hypothetical protein
MVHEGITALAVGEERGMVVVVASSAGTQGTMGGRLVPP